MAGTRPVGLYVAAQPNPLHKAKVPFRRKHSADGPKRFFLTRVVGEWTVLDCILGVGATMDFP